VGAVQGFTLRSAAPARGGICGSAALDVLQMNLKDAAEVQLEQNLKEMEMLECCVLIKLALTAECEVIYIYI